jgi:ADP-sugar diphosphatase
MSSTQNHSMSCFTKDCEPEYRYRGVQLKAGAPHLNQCLAAVNDAPKYQKWIDDFFEQGQIDIKSFTLTDVNWFGSVLPDRLGFFKGVGEIYEAGTTIPIPSNIAFCRGGCVSCLVVCTAIIDGVIKKLVPLTEQLRFPSGGKRQEAMAGMLDASTRDWKGPVVKELEEEFGIKIAESDHRLQRLPGKKAWPSPGGCDEAIDLFYLELDITQEQYADMSTRVYGDGNDEKIRIRFYDYATFDETLNEIGDFKAGEMWRRYQWLKQQQRRDAFNSLVARL